MRSARYLALTAAGLLIFGLSACSANTSETAGTSLTSADTSVSSVATDDTGASSADTSKAYKVEVYEYEKAGSEGKFIIPAIRINGVNDDVVNDKIRSYVDSLDMEWYSGSEYSCYAGEDYVSILVRGISTIDLDSYEAFNVALDDGHLMDNEEFFAAAGTTRDAFFKLVGKTVGDAIKDDRDGVFADNEFMNYHDANLAEKNMNLAIPFMSDRGNLCFIYNLYMNVGAEEYTVCFDTTTHEHMLNDFGHWTLYPEWG